MYIRSYTWGEATISWSAVIEELLKIPYQKGDLVDFQSTNGYDNTIFWDQDKAISASLKCKEAILKHKVPYDIDITYTIPFNFKDRFLGSSKLKLAIYNYESSIMPSNWTQHYKYVDYVLPTSNYVKEAFLKNGCPKEKIVVVPHGIDSSIFNLDVRPLPALNDNKFKFLCVAEPHERKKISSLIKLYSKTFEGNKDVSLIVKTRIPAKDKKPYEVDIRETLKEVKAEYKDRLPEIKLITNRLKDLASLYRSCQAFVIMTAAEGWCMPLLESLVCGTPIIAPRYSGQLDFLNDNNATLIETIERLAKKTEQYVEPTKGALVGQVNEEKFSLAMLDMVKNYSNYKNEKFLTEAKLAAEKYTWKNAWSQIEALL